MTDQTSTRPLIRLGVAVAAAALVLGGCGGGPFASDDPDVAAASGPDALAEAARTTLAEPTMAFDLRISFDGDAPSIESSVMGRGEFASGRGEVVARYDGNEVRAIVEGTGFWFTSDEADFTRLMPPDASWVRASFDELDGSEAVTPVEVPALLYLLAGATDVQADATGDGVIGYAFALDVDAAVAAAPRDRQAEVRDLLWSSDGVLDATGEAVVDDGHVRTLVAVGTVSSSDESVPDMRLRWEASFDDFGAEVTVDPPDADDVVELADLPEVQAQFFPAG